MKKYGKKDAKKGMLKALSKDMSDMMGENYKDLTDKKMKVTVASDSEEGLKEGLSKADEIMKMKLGKDAEEKEEEKEMESEEMDSEEVESEEEMDYEDDDMHEEDHEEMSKEELEEKIEHLKKMLESKE